MEMLPLMNKTKYAVMIGAVLFVGAILAITQTAQFSAGQVMKQSISSTNAINTGNQDTAKLETHLVAAKNALEAGNTNGALTHLEVALKLINHIQMECNNNNNNYGILEEHLVAAENTLKADDTQGSLDHLDAALNIQSECNNNNNNS
jgi:hypothetical protein